MWWVERPVFSLFSFAVKKTPFPAHWAAFRRVFWQAFQTGGLPNGPMLAIGDYTKIKNHPHFGVLLEIFLESLSPFFS